MKICVRCKKLKDLVDFSNSKLGKFGKDSECKDCNKISTKIWYNKHRLKECAKTREHNRANQVWLNNQKNFPCMDCKIKYPSYIMQFDHQDPKTKSGRILCSRSIKWLQEEIKKCDLVCANCHMERTYQQRQNGILIRWAIKC